MDKYVVSDKSPNARGTVDKLRIERGGEPVELKKEQVERLSQVGVEVVPAKTDSNS